MFQFEGTVTSHRYFETKSEVLLWAENRDLSQLALLKDEAFREGLARLSAEETDEIATEAATIDLTAVLRS